jgi:subtilisin-like proprotein convertase family protein
VRSPIRRNRKRSLLAASTVVLVALTGGTAPAAADPPRVNRGISDTTAAQIAALQQIKRSVSPAESKVASALVVEQRIRSDARTSSALPALDTGVDVLESGAVLVDVRAVKVTDALVAAVTSARGEIRSVSAAGATIRARLPLGAVTGLAARPDVRAVEPAVEAVTSATSPPGDRDRSRRPSKEDKVAVVRERAARAPAEGAPLITSEGDRAHAADTARRRFGVSGFSTKLCALSDGVDSLAASVASGELPDVDVLPGQEGAGDEGTAMLEILHDTAPGAELGFATAFNGDGSFADNIRALRFELGCDVIVDDVVYFNESPFQDGVIAQAVEAVVADGAVYFSSAGNQGSVSAGTSAHWEGRFADSGAALGKFAGTAHDFDPDPARVQAANPLSVPGFGGAPVTLFWAEPLGRAASDYDLYATDAAGDVVAFSQSVQNGTQDPYERITANVADARISVVKYSGADHHLSLSSYRGRFADTADGLTKFVTPGTISGHAAAKGAIGVAAAPAAGAYDGYENSPVGPFPGTFTRASGTELFTSDGPRRTFFAADGSPAEEVRQKPDLTAADGVRTSVSGFDPFYGTSAAAPAAAAVAGLILSGNPGLSPAEVRAALTSTALDVGARGVDVVSGAGVVMADRALRHTGASPQPLAVVGTPTVRNADGSAFLKPGTAATISVPVTNRGDGTAASTSLVLDASAGATLTPRSRSYGSVRAGATTTKDFTLRIPASAVAGDVVRVGARLTFAGALSPSTGGFDLVVGEPARVRDFAFAGAPVPIPDDSTVGASVEIPVSGVGRPSSLSVSVDGGECSAETGATGVGLDHTYLGDVTGTLTSPSGATATLFQRDGAFGKNLCRVVFSDSGARAFASASGDEAPFTGTWRAAEPLSPLLNGSADGTWTFTVVDGTGGDTGSIRAVSLHVAGWSTGTT